jgi:hypothetical protein
MGVSGAMADRADSAEPKDVPMVVVDKSAAGWVVDRFAGNSTAGPRFFQGPAREATVANSPSVAPVGDGGVVFIGTGDSILRVGPDGMLRLVAGGGTKLGDCAGREAMIRLEKTTRAFAWSAADRSLYFAHRTIPSVRRLFEKNGEWRVEVVAGSPAEKGYKDGPAKAARFSQPRALDVDGEGTIYVVDGNHLRRIANGQVETLNSALSSGKLKDGSLTQARFNLTAITGNIAVGDDQTLYVADNWNWAVRRIDLKSMTVSTLAHSTKEAQGKRHNEFADGPAMTHASARPGWAYAAWDSVHRALWIAGGDDSRVRWLKDGWVKSVLATKYGIQAGPRDKVSWPYDSLGVPGEAACWTWIYPQAVDEQGRLYIRSGSHAGVWRAYDKKTEAKK